MGGKGGGKGGGSSINVEPSPYEQAMAQMAQEVFQQTRPIRSNFLEDWGNFMRPYGGTGAALYPGTPTGGGGGAGAGGGMATPSPGGVNYTGQGMTYTPGPYKEGEAGRITPEAQNYAPAEWAKIYQDSANAPRLPSGISVMPSDPTQYGQTNPAYFAPAGYVGGQVGSPIFSYPTTGGRYFDREGQEYFGDPSQVLWAQGFTPGTTGAGGGGGTTPTSPGSPPGGYQGTGTQFGAYNPYNLPGYQPIYQLARQGTESQFAQARQALIGSLPRGGSLAQGLTNLEIQRAIEAGSLPAQIATPLIQDIMSKAYGAAWNAPQQSMAGLGGAANAYASRYGTQGQYQLGSSGQTLGSLSGLGGLMSMGSKKGGTGVAGAEALQELMTPMALLI